MLKIRLARVGRRNRPHFRVVLTPKSKPPKSGYIAVLGNYDPIKKNLEINKKELKEWLEKGAQPSDTVHNILVKNKIITGKKIKTSKDKLKQASKTEKKEEKTDRKEKSADKDDQDSTKEDKKRKDSPKKPEAGKEEKEDKESKNKAKE
jgi:small subunit ribosomal protein S16